MSEFRKSVQYVVADQGKYHMVWLPHSSPLMARAVCGVKPPVGGWNDTNVPMDKGDLCKRCVQWECLRGAKHWASASGS